MASTQITQMVVESAKRAVEAEIKRSQQAREAINRWTEKAETTEDDGLFGEAFLLLLSLEDAAQGYSRVVGLAMAELKGVQRANDES